MCASVAEDQRIRRRDFIGGAWLRSSRGQDAYPAETASTTASIVVRARPDRLDQLQEAIAALGLIVAPDDAPGRLVVSAPALDVAATLSLITDVPGVVDAAVLDAQRPGIPS